MIVNKKEYEVKLFLGPMWSFKTTHLINFINRKKDEGKIIWTFSPEGTQREDRPFLDKSIELKWQDAEQEPDVINGLPIEKPPRVVDTNDFLDKVNKLNLNDGDWIAIDEIQFFDLVFPLELKKLSKKYNIVVAGLSVNYTSRFFETTHRVCQFATQIIELESLCYECYEPAKYYEKKKGEKEGIGGEDLYKPKCFKHVNLLTRTLRW